LGCAALVSDSHSRSPLPEDISKALDKRGF